MRRGPVSAAAMQARTVVEDQSFRSRHCSAEEYDAFLASCCIRKHFGEQRRSHRKLFVDAWPDLEAWLHASLAERVGRINGQTRGNLSNRPSYFARAYLYYLALKGYLRIDYDWLLAVGDLCIHDVVRHMQIDLGVETLAREGAALGLRMPAPSIGRAVRVRSLLELLAVRDDAGLCAAAARPSSAGAVPRR